MQYQVIILDTTGTTYTFYEIEKRKETKKINKNNEDNSKEKRTKKKNEKIEETNCRVPPRRRCVARFGCCSLCAYHDVPCLVGFSDVDASGSNQEYFSFCQRKGRHDLGLGRSFRCLVSVHFRYEASFMCFAHLFSSLPRASFLLRKLSCALSCSHGAMSIVLALRN